MDGNSPSLVEISKMARGLVKGFAKPLGGGPPVRIKAYGDIGEQKLKPPPGVTKTRHDLHAL